MRLPHTALDDWQRANPRKVDMLLVAALWLPSILFSATGTYGVRGMILNGAQLVPLIWRRDRPTLAFAVVSLGCATQVLMINAPLLFGNVGFLIALYSLSAYEWRRYLRYLGLAVALLGCVLAMGSWGIYGSIGSGDLSSIARLLIASGFMAAFVVPCWMAGDLVRTRRAYVAEVEERARRLERERDQQARLAATAERARIVREMHDVVAHSLSVVIAQADGGAYIAEQDPPTARKAFETIGTTGRQALGEMRRLLGVLSDQRREGAEGAQAGAAGSAGRAEGAPQSSATRTGEPAPDGVEYAPQPGLDQLPALLDSIRGTHLEVGFTETGERRHLEQGAQLVIYRIVQEALTNVLKHAGPRARAEVTLAWTPTSLRVVISDDGRGATANSDNVGSGLGLVGMRQRIAVYGGSVVAGPRTGGGFEVRAELALD